MTKGNATAATPDEIVSFWLDEVGPEGWYTQDDALDQTIRDRFKSTWDAAMEGRFALWLTYPTGTLAYLILTDQFPRNMFRDDKRAFASDRIALAVAKKAIGQGYDSKIDPPAQQFFYLPLMHSENLCDQERCVRLLCERMRSSENNLLHARVHREIIRRFGRFPYRNAALGRRMTDAEADFLDKGGYGQILRDLEEKSAA